MYMNRTPPEPDVFGLVARLCIGIMLIMLTIKLGMVLF